MKQVKVIRWTKDPRLWSWLPTWAVSQLVWIIWASQCLLNFELQVDYCIWFWRHKIPRILFLQKLFKLIAFKHHFTLYRINFAFFFSTLQTIWIYLAYVPPLTNWDDLFLTFLYDTRNSQVSHYFSSAFYF